MSTDPFQQLVHSRQAHLMADARRHALAREALSHANRGPRFRTAAAGRLFAAASRLEAPARVPRPSTGL